MKPISEYKKNDGYYDDAGAYYDTLEDFLQIYILGFCGCGHRSAVLKLIHDLVMLKKDWMSSERYDWTTYNDLLTKYLIENISSIRWFFDYFLDKKEITCHGGNVSGGWVDDNFLEAIKLWHTEYESE
jgi:hypothetical protein